MTERSLVLSASEREFLAELLKEVLKSTRVEEHRTRTSTFREHIVHRETLITGLLKKLGATAD